VDRVHHRLELEEGAQAVDRVEMDADVVEEPELAALAHRDQGRRLRNEQAWASASRTGSTSYALVRTPSRSGRSYG